MKENMKQIREALNGFIPNGLNAENLVKAIALLEEKGFAKSESIIKALTSPTTGTMYYDSKDNKVLEAGCVINAYKQLRSHIQFYHNLVKENQALDENLAQMLEGCINLVRKGDQTSLPLVKEFLDNFQRFLTTSEYDSDKLETLAGNADKLIGAFRKEGDSTAYHVMIGFRNFFLTMAAFALICMCVAGMAPTGSVALITFGCSFGAFALFVGGAIGVDALKSKLTKDWNPNIDIYHGARKYYMNEKGNKVWDKATEWNTGNPFSYLGGRVSNWWKYRNTDIGRKWEDIHIAYADKATQGLEP